MGKRTVTLYEDIKHQVDLAEKIHEELSNEILALTEEVARLRDQCQSLTNRLTIARNNVE